MRSCWKFIICEQKFLGEMLMMANSEHFALGFLKGMLDGDGSIYAKCKSVYLDFELKSINLTNILEEYVASLNLKPHRYLRHRERRWIRPNKTYHFFTTMQRIQVRLSSDFYGKLLLVPLNKEQEKGYVSGLFQAEGSHWKIKHGKQKCEGLRIYNTNTALLTRISTICQEYGISFKLREYKGITPYLDIQNRFINSFVQIFGEKIR